MPGNKLSQFIKKRYSNSPENTDVVIEEDLEEEMIFKKVLKEDEVLVEQSEVVINEEEGMVRGDDFKLVEEETVGLKEDFEEESKDLVDYERSYQGRIYGWWVCIDGEQVASLEYRTELEKVVHLYRVNVLNEGFLRIDLESEKWRKKNVTFQSRYAMNYIKQGLSMAAVGEGMIVVEDLIVPEDHFCRRHKELEEFHQMLIEKAKSKSRA